MNFTECRVNEYERLSLKYSDKNIYDAVLNTIETTAFLMSLLGVLNLSLNLFGMIYNGNIRNKHYLYSVIHIGTGWFSLIFGHIGLYMYIFDTFNHSNTSNIFDYICCFCMILFLFNGITSLALLPYLYSKLSTFSRLLIIGQLAAIFLPFLYFSYMLNIWFNHIPNIYNVIFICLYTFLFGWYSLITICDFIVSLPLTMYEFGKIKKNNLNETYDKYSPLFYFTWIFKFSQIERLCQNKGLKLFDGFYKQSILPRINATLAIPVFLFWMINGMIINTNSNYKCYGIDTLNILSNGVQSIILYGLIGNAGGVFSLTLAVRRFKKRQQSIILYNLYSFILPNIFIFTFAFKITLVEQTDVGFLDFVFLNF